MIIVNNTYHIRLINGEEIIAKIFRYNETEISVENPLVVSSIVGKNNQEQIVLNNYIPFSKDKTCSIKRAQIITITSITKEIQKYYELSLRIVDTYDKQIIESISETNEAIQKALSLSEKTEKYSDSLQAHYIAGSNTKH